MAQESRSAKERRREKRTDYTNGKYFSTLRSLSEYNL